MLTESYFNKLRILPNREKRKIVSSNNTKDTFGIKTKLISRKPLRNSTTFVLEVSLLGATQISDSK